MTNYKRFTLSIFALLFTTLSQAAVNQVCLVRGHTEEVANYVNLFANDQAMFKATNLRFNILNSVARSEVTEEISKRAEKKINKVGKGNIKMSDCAFLITTFDSTFRMKKKHINEFKLLYSAYYGGSYDTHFIVKKGSNIKSVKDLDNKNIRLGQLGTMLAFRNMLIAEKSEDLKVKTLDIDSTRLLEELKSSKVAMGTSYFPTMPVDLATGEVEIFKKNIFSTYLNTPYPHSLILVRKSTMDKNPEMVKKYKEIIDNVLGVMAKSPMVIAKTLRTHTKDLGMSPWNITDAQIEKGEEQYTQLNFIAGNEAIAYKNGSTTPKEVFATLIKELQAAKYINSDADLNFLF